MSNRREHKTTERHVRNARYKQIRFGIPRKSCRMATRSRPRQFVPPEDWHEPLVDRPGGFQVITQDAGSGFAHVVTKPEIEQRLSLLPQWMLESLDVVQLSRMTRKKLSLPCYGMQWGPAIYLYPVEETLIEIFNRPPQPAVLVETKMYGGKWQEGDPGIWKLVWNERTIKDFYLNNILIHELGHLLDGRNNSYEDRERYAEWFAIRYGYLPTRAAKKSKKRPKRRHHAC